VYFEYIDLGSFMLLVSNASHSVKSGIASHPILSLASCKDERSSFLLLSLIRKYLMFEQALRSLESRQGTRFCIELYRSRIWERPVCVKGIGFRQSTGPFMCDRQTPRTIYESRFFQHRCLLHSNSCLLRIRKASFLSDMRDIERFISQYWRAALRRNARGTDGFSSYIQRHVSPGIRWLRMWIAIPCTFLRTL